MTLRRLRPSTWILLTTLAGCPAPAPTDAGPLPTDTPTSGGGGIDTGSDEDTGVDGGRPDAPTGLDTGEPPDTGETSDAGMDVGCDPRVGVPCPGAPDAPVIDGEPSAGHDDPTWTWTEPTGAVSYEYRFDGGAWVPTTDRFHRESGLADGTYVIEVIACDAEGVCSVPASFTTVVETLGPGYPGVWAGVARPDLTTTAVGHVVPISCHNCYNGPSNEVYPTSMALAKIGTALTNGADLIELDIGDSSGTLCVHHDDPVSCAGAPTLEEILDDATLAAADAMLFVEIKEGTTAPATFAAGLLAMLDAHREVVRNGRPLFLRAFATSRDYLLAIQSAASNYPMIAPYLRYSVLYGATARPIAELHTEIADDVAGAGFHMLELNYQQSNLASLAHHAQSLGLGVGVWTIPGSFGEVFIAGLREMVDAITAEYRADRARLVAEEANTFAYVDPWDCASAADTSMEILRNHTGVIELGSFMPATPAPVGGYGTPPLMLEGPGEDRFGCSLDHRTVSGITDRAVNLGTHAPGPGAGYLVTAVVNFDALAGLMGTQAIVNNADSGGFALETIGDGTTTTVRFGVHVGGAYRYHNYNVASTGLADDPSLNGTDAYLLIGAYDGDGGVYLFIDNDRVGSGGTFTGDVTTTAQPVLIGADPQAGTPSARFFFDGMIQQVSVLRWGDHSFAGSLVN